MVNFNNLLFRTLHFLANLIIIWGTLLTSFILNFKLSSKLNNNNFLFKTLIFSGKFNNNLGNFVNFVYLELKLFSKLNNNFLW